MKSILLLSLGSLLILSSCNSDDDVQQIPHDGSIVGTWELIEYFGSDGAENPQWKVAEDRYTYTFDSDGSFTTTRFSECDFGRYELNDSILTLQYGCFEPPKGTFINNFRLSADYMILTPQYLTCIEGCGSKFRKIKS